MREGAGGKGTGALVGEGGGVVVTFPRKANGERTVRRRRKQRGGNGGHVCAVKEMMPAQCVVPTTRGRGKRQGIRCKGRGVVAWVVAWGFAWTRTRGMGRDRIGGAGNEGEGRCLRRYYAKGAATGMNVLVV